MCAFVLAIVGSPYAFAQEEATPSSSFDGSYERYNQVATDLKESVEADSATVSEQKSYFEAVVRLFITQNDLMLADLSKKVRTDSVVSVLETIQEDGEMLQEILSKLETVTDEEGVAGVADLVAEYVDSYAQAIRGPVLIVYADRFITDVIQPAQKRYAAMKEVVDAAKESGKDVDAYEDALSEARSKLYEAKGLLDDVVLMLSEDSYSLTAIEVDMIQAQDAVKKVYAIYKDLSLKSAALFTQ